MTTNGKITPATAGPIFDKLRARVETAANACYHLHDQTMGLAPTISSGIYASAAMLEEMSEDMAALGQFLVELGERAAEAEA